MSQINEMSVGSKMTFITESSRGEFHYPNDAQLTWLTIFSVFMALEFTVILALAIHNLIRYIIVINYNKAMIKVFYALACIESALIIGACTYQAFDP